MVCFFNFDQANVLLYSKLTAKEFRTNTVFFKTKSFYVIDYQSYLYLLGIFSNGRSWSQIRDGLDVAALSVDEGADEVLRVGRDLEQEDRSAMDADGDEAQPEGRDPWNIKLIYSLLSYQVSDTIAFSFVSISASGTHYIVCQGLWPS